MNSHLGLAPLTLSLALALLASTSVGCGEDTPACIEQLEGGCAGKEQGEASADSDSGTNVAAEVAVCQERGIECLEEQILDLFNETPATGGITNTREGQEFLSVIDARAGGFGGAESFVYAVFTEDGLEQVALSDEESLESQDWDIAFRRFIVRANSGVGGPGCVEIASFPAGESFASADSSASLKYESESYYDAVCQLVPDGSGLPSAPKMLMSGFWSYTGCLAMTGQVYAIRLADGRQFKLEMESYYSEGQEGCNVGGAGGSDSGTLSMRWAEL